jgi:hypothetical protein
MRYFSWRQQPAVIVSVNEDSVRGYYFQNGKWQVANVHQVASFFNTELDFSADGHELTKDEFANKFNDVLDSLVIESKTK